MATIELHGALMCHLLPITADEPANVEWPVEVVLVADDGIMVPMGRAWSWARVQDCIATVMRRFD